MTTAEQKILNTRHIPEGYRLVEGITPTTAVYYKEHGDRFIFLGFWGRSINPTKHCYFTSAEKRQAYTDNFLANYKSQQERVAKRRAETKVAQAAGHGVQVGDIFDCSWGYDQTNIDYYQVTKLVGKTMVEIRQISAHRTDSPHFTYDNVIPVKDSFIDRSHLNDYKSNEPVRKRVNVNSFGGRTSVSISVYSFASAYPWDGKPQHQTALGYGH